MECEESARELRPTNCHYCGYLCAFNATVEDGRVTDLQPDPTRYPYDERVLAGCRRWRTNVETLDGADRVNYPLRRAGVRGSGEFQRVSWDEALDDIAGRLRALAREHGPATLASMIGGPHTSFWPLHRFMNLFGSPNNMGIGQICWNPRIWMDVVTFGWTIEADIRYGTTDCLLVWGTNPAQSDNSAFWQSLREFSQLNKAYGEAYRETRAAQGAEAADPVPADLAGIPMPIVVIDPRFTRTASLADIWVPIKPGTDVVFALGLMNVLFAEGLVNEAFVTEWCHGADELAAAAAPYTPVRVAETCGIDEALVTRVARLWGNAQAGALVSGRGIDQVGRNVAPTHRAICCLRALRGFVDAPGTMILQEESDFVSEYELEATAKLAPEHRARCLNTAFTPLQCYEGFEYMASLTQKHGRQLPERYLTSAHPDLVLRAMETGEPYPVRALIVEATNPLLTYADTHRVFKALMGLDLIVVLDYYLTSTAQVADYVLPSAAAIERATFQAHGGVANIAYGGPAAVAPYYERKCDYEIFRELGLRVGQAVEDWPWATFEEALAYTLQRAGMSWEEYCRMGIYHRPPQPYKHLQPAAPAPGAAAPAPEPAAAVPRGFATSTGKVELASEALAALGGPRVPQPAACTHDSLCSPALAALAHERGGAQLRLITGARKQPFNASMYFNIPRFRRETPHAVAEMSPATAEQLGLVAGETLVVATDRGEARFILALATMRDGLLSVDYGWWHPEWKPGAPDFGGIWESNVNCLTSCSVEDGEPMIGTWSYNAIECVVWKADEPLA